ncbi:methylaspartate ammonia-lyase [Paractinoplanes deccanensis]|uniref:methylaspartate ammonia-lyase n=1 Tax=Paractinoplanes deccanensis TaxID=113561 RepID=A0ABQ3XY96_9ACTN|nr:methylaspartate ammonia-lyase [Actinoplanes deccanensis]GID72689.1 methylaspartate ammonia-lyase [Actinoplanes deccanensis]
MPPRIWDVTSVATEAAYFVDDQAAVRAGARRDGFRYRGRPLTPGFREIREPGQALTVLVRLDDGVVLTGDCAGVQYSGVAGRAAPMSAVDGARLVGTVLRPALVGREVASFRGLSEVLAALALPPWLAYGASQALVRAVASARRRPIAGVIVDEWGLPVPSRTVPVLAQSGETPRAAADRMILKRADALPHGLVNNVDACLGRRGEKLLDLVRWLSGRITELAGPAGPYRPVLHFDVYGTVGEAFGTVDRVARYLLTLAAAAAPYRLRVEHPVDAGDRDRQIETLAALRRSLRGRVELVADEWCNTLPDVLAFAAAGCVDMIHVKTPDLGGLDRTVEALLACRRHGVAGYCGGSSNETAGSAQVCAQVALACGAELVLAKPGMGVDEGLSIVRNEMRLALAQVAPAPIAQLEGA